ncbi:tachykinin-3 isoform 1-T1 [Geothlypis trichas]
MKNRPVLAVLLLLALPLALARRAPAAPPGPAPGMPVPEPLPWSPRGSPRAAAAAAALELLREEGAGEGREGSDGRVSVRPVLSHPFWSLPGPPAAPQKSKSRPVPVSVPAPVPVPLTAGLSAGDMHDFFVGLMGKRAAEPGRAAGRGGGSPAPRCSPGPPAPGEAPLRAA